MLFRESEMARQEEYRAQLAEMKERVDQQPFLFERTAQVISMNYFFYPISLTPLFTTHCRFFQFLELLEASMPHYGSTIYGMFLYKS